MIGDVVGRATGFDDIEGLDVDLGQLGGLGDVLPMFSTICPLKSAPFLASKGPVLKRLRFASSFLSQIAAPS